MKINFKAIKRLIERFKAVLVTHVAAEDKDLVKRLTERSMKTTQNGLGGYRVDSPITDWNEVEKELDKAKKIVDNESSLSEKDKIFRDCLLVLMKSIDVKTRKVDRLITELEEME